MNVAAGGHAQSALQRGGQVGDDVAKHVVGDDHVERFWIAHHLQAERVDVHVLRLNLGILLRDFFEDALPQAAGVSHHVRLVGHHDFLAAVVARVLKREMDDALHALAGVDVFLGRDFLRACPS